jgi:hypothetical protein
VTSTVMDGSSDLSVHVAEEARPERERSEAFGEPRVERRRSKGIPGPRASSVHRVLLRYGVARVECSGRSVRTARGEDVDLVAGEGKGQPVPWVNASALTREAMVSKGIASRPSWFDASESWGVHRKVDFE